MGEVGHQLDYLLSVVVPCSQVRGVSNEGRADDCKIWRPLPDEGRDHRMPEGGHWKPERVVVIEFPDMDSLNAWYNSAE